jgi:hypothetical protein
MSEPSVDDLGHELISAAEAQNWPAVGGVIANAVTKDALLGLCQWLVAYQPPPTPEMTAEDEIRGEHAALQYAVGLLRGDPWTQGEAYLAAANRGSGGGFRLVLRAMSLVNEQLEDDERVALLARLRHELDGLLLAHSDKLATEDADSDSDPEATYLDEPLRKLLGDDEPPPDTA